MPRNARERDLPAYAADASGHRHSRSDKVASADSSGPSTFNAPSGRDCSFDNQENGKRNRYQYSCLQCQRRKQRCSRTFPCEKCMQRGIAHLCSPPSNLHRPSRRIRMRQKLALALSAQRSASGKEKDRGDMEDMDTYELDHEHDADSSQTLQGTSSMARGSFLQFSPPYSHLDPADSSSSMFEDHRKAYERSPIPQHLDCDRRNAHHQHRQEGQPPSADQYQSSDVNYHRRSQSLYQIPSHPQMGILSSTPTVSRGMSGGRASLSSPTRMLPPVNSSSNFSSSSAHTPSISLQQDMSRASRAQSNTLANAESESAHSGADALARLAMVAQWPSLQQQQQGKQVHTTSEDQLSRPPRDTYPSLAPGTTSQTAIASAVLTTPSSTRSQQSAHGLDSDQRSMVDADDAFIGKPALNGLGWNPFRRHEGIGTDLLSWTGHLGRGFGLVIPKYELRSVQQSLPSKSEAHRLLQIYLDDFNWSRFPLSPQELVKSVDACLDRAPISDDVQMLPLMASCLSIFGLATLDLAVRPYPTRSSRTYFFAARKALSLSESLGLHTLDSLSASLNLCRYLDLCRVPRSTWLQVALCMRGAIDLGLHLDGAHLGQNCSSTLQRRVLWSHIVHQDREWSVLFGRPMTEIPFSTTPAPTLQDYLSTGLELACAHYLVVRDAFRAYIERISRLFQEIAASSTSSPTSRIYERALEIDRDIVEFTKALPPCLSISSPLSGGAMKHQDFSTTFYHHLCTNQILFFRSLLHRPFWMESSDLVLADTYKHSRQICVDLALTDLRGRRLLSRRIPVTMLCHLYGSAYSLLSMNTIIASDMLFALEFGETLQSEEVQEKLGYIQEYVATVRANIQESRGDHLAVKELYVMRSLLKRIQDKVATLNPQSVGFQVLGVRYPGGCADRLTMTLTELQSAANLLLNMARAGVRIDDATRIPPSGEERISATSQSGAGSAASSDGVGAAASASHLLPHSRNYPPRDCATFSMGGQPNIGTGADAASVSGMLDAANASGVTPSADSLDLFLSNADEWLSSLLNPGAAAFSAPTQPLDFGFSLF